ncbi:MAG: hypothetical protein JWP18_1485 [Solirubrobacterales bacterium]|nr:hypothetical protein [Solirubrobacterales bacterium]
MRDRAPQLPRSFGPSGTLDEMTDASARAREILDAIERDAFRRREAMTTPLSPPLRPAVAAPEPPVPTLTAPAPDPATSSAPPTHEAARLLALVDHVVEQTKHAQQRLEALDSAVTALSRRLGVEGELDRTPVMPVSSVVPAAPAARPEDGEATAAGLLAPFAADLEPLERLEPLEDEPAAVSPPPVRRPPSTTHSDGARLVAIEMAVAGFSRGEVQDRLVREYGLTAPGAILDDVFGAGSRADSRMPWGAV